VLFGPKKEITHINTGFDDAEKMLKRGYLKRWTYEDDIDDET